MGESIHHRICPLCEACCGLEIKTDGGRVTAIRGHDEDVFSGGYLCPKGVALKDLHEDPDRLGQPLVRRGGRLVPATWEEAFAEIEQRLPALRAAHGREEGPHGGEEAAPRCPEVTHFGREEDATRFQGVSRALRGAPWRATVGACAPTSPDSGSPRCCAAARG